MLISGENVDVYLSVANYTMIDNMYGDHTSVKTYIYIYCIQQANRWRDKAMVNPSSFFLLSFPTLWDINCNCLCSFCYIKCRCRCRYYLRESVAMIRRNRFSKDKRQHSTKDCNDWAQVNERVRTNDTGFLLFGALFKE